MSKSDFGLIGLAVMGQNLVLNVESRGFKVSVYNRTTETMKQFIAENSDKNLYGAETLEDFIESLERPRKVMILVKSSAGGDPNDRDAVDKVIDSLVPLLDEGDLIIDGGNTYIIHTERRSKDLADKGLLIIGSGVSGGEEGARKGPSIMPGGPTSSWEIIQPIFNAKCTECHDENKVKGDLRIDSFEWLSKGGDITDQEVIPGDAEASELYFRVVLDPEEDDFMPP